MTQEDISLERAPVVPRKRPRAITFERAERKPEPEPQSLVPSETENYEYRNDPLPTHIPERIRVIAKTSKGAAREEVMRWMAPFFIQGATAPQIAQAFNISIHTVPIWRRQYREALRKEIVTKSPIEHYAEAAGRLNTYRKFLFSQLVDQQANGQMDGNNNDGESPAGRRRSKVTVVRALLDLEKTELLLNTGYGVAKQSVFDRATSDGTEMDSPEQALVSASKEFLTGIAGLANASREELEKQAFGETSPLDDLLETDEKFRLSSEEEDEDGDADE